MFFIFIILVIINVFINFDSLVINIYESLFIWFYNIYPSIFIFYNISSFLIYNKAFIKISKLMKFFISFDSEYSYAIFIISILLGNPGSSKLIQNSFDNNYISKNDYTKLNNITFFVNPLFILSFINFKNYIIYLICSFIYIKIYVIIKRYNKKNCYYIYNDNITINYNIFSKNINDVINILLNVAAMVSFFSGINNTIKLVLDYLNINNWFINFIFSNLEISNGLVYLKNNNYKLIYTIYLISFQGICILMQSYSVISKKNISFIRYILYNFLRAIIISLMFYIITLFHI